MRVELGLQCSNRCVFCAQGNMAEAERAPELGAVLARIRALPAGARLALVGGEPLISPLLWPALDAAREQGARVLLQTNGRALDAGTVAKLAPYSVELDVSLQGATAALHDYHTGVSGSFGETLAGLERARAAALPTGISHVITRSSFRHLEALVALAARVGARAVHLMPAEAAGRAWDHRASVIPAREMVRPHLLRALARARRAGLEVVSGPHTTNDSARLWFAGIGRQQPAEHAATTPSRSAEPRRLPLLASEPAHHLEAGA